MFKPERICWFNIILTSVFLLLLRHINATGINDDVPHTTSHPTDSNSINNYESIDVAQHGANENLHVQTGQTTRILTSGEVDDNFWLKHLGEDFKYAVHLQVGDSDHYNGIYNMTEDGSNYDVNHDYRIKEIPVDGYRKQTSKEIESVLENQTFPEINNVNYTTHNEFVDKIHKRQNSTTTYESNTHKGAYVVDEKIRDLVKNQGALRNHNEIPIPHYTKYTKPSKIQNINIRYAHKNHPDGEKQEHNQTENDHKELNDTHSQERKLTQDMSNNQDTPIVVTLPLNDNMVHRLADENTPVIVKMPPVIYHEGPTYARYPAEEPSIPGGRLNPPQHTLLTQHQYTHQMQQPLQYESNNFPQYNHISPHAKHSQPLIPQAHPQQYYNPSLLHLEPPAVYSHNDNLYPPPAQAPASTQDDNSIAIDSPKEELPKSSDSVHFILRKSAKAYDEETANNEVTTEKNLNIKY